MNPAGVHPVVSVVIPTRDRWSLLNRALGTALAQVGVDLEVIVVDDGSSDGTPSRLRAAAHPRVRLVARPQSMGVAEARNLAIGMARGEWLAFLDDDDVWAPDKLRRQLDAAGPGVSFVYTGALVIDGAGRVTGVRRTAGVDELEPGLFETNLVGTPSGVMARTDLLRRLGGFDRAFGILADWDLWIRLMGMGRVAVCEEALIGYTQHPANMHLADPDKLRVELDALRAKHREACELRGVELGGLAFTRWLVGRYRAAGMRSEAARLYLGIGLRYRSPRDVLRAIGLMLGEPAMRLARGGAPRTSVDTPVTEPEWLLALRSRGDQAFG